MASAQVGMRVLRGPDWPGGNCDGGEGHLGTVVALLDGAKVRVLWDNGRQAEYRSGAEGRFDLRVFDTGPVGIRHKDTVCAACEEQHIYGMIWRCQSCRSCTLCSLCYVSDKHDIKHGFLRYDQPGHSGEAVKKRSVSLKIRAIGIFPGAKVKRGKDWAWADQDGGEGSEGEVVGFENVAPDSSRNIVRVHWPHGKTNSYRLGLRGNVDLLCVEEEAGTFYYRDHLPVLGTNAGVSSPGPDSDNSAMFARASASSQQTAPPSGTTATSATAGGGNNIQAGGEITSVQVGDKVVVHVAEEKLKELQAKYGGVTATMLKCIGRQGEVVSFAPNGAVSIKFEKIAYRLNPEAVRKIPALSVGDMVRICSDKEQVKLLNRRVIWKPEMEMMLGKVGQVTKIDSDGDVVVSFGSVAAIFSPGCCIPVSAGTSFDSVGSGSSSNGGRGSAAGSSSSSSASSNDSNDYGELHQNLMKFIAQMAGIPLKGSGGGGGGSSGGGGGDAMGRFLRAIARGDLPSVRALCQENKDLLNQVHKGMTPLMVAAHEGQKDVCACLLAQGADVNRPGDKGNTPLGAALEGKKEQVAIFLLEKGAHPNVRNDKNRNPVHLAAYSNMPDVLKLLIQKGGDVNAKDQYGDTPLHGAIERQNTEAVDMLIRARNIDLQAQNKKGFNMLQQAALKGNAHAIERILARDAGQVDKLLDGQFSALHIAANNDHVECVKLLVNNGGAEVDVVGHKGLVPLHMACIKGHVASLEALVQLGASVNIQDRDGDTPLHLAVGTKVENAESLYGQLVQKNRIRMAYILLSKGAYPNLRNKNGREPLQCCPHPAIRSAVEQFMKENPSVIKRKGGTTTTTTTATTTAAASSGTRRRASAGLDLGALLRGMALPCGAPGCRRFSDITLLPCGHKALCRACCLQTSDCPVCSCTIERRVHKRGDSESDLADACKQM